jgi:hypothetical protein
VKIAPGLVDTGCAQCVRGSTARMSTSGVLQYCCAAPRLAVDITRVTAWWSYRLCAVKRSGITSISTSESTRIRPALSIYVHT